MLNKYRELGGRDCDWVPWDLARKHARSPFTRKREAVVDTLFGMEPQKRRRKTWQQVYEENNTIIFNLLDLGIRKEDMFPTQLPNCIENYYASIFTSKIGAIYPALQVEMSEEWTKELLELLDPDAAIVIPIWEGREIAKWYLEYQKTHPKLKYIFVVTKPDEPIPEGTRPFSELLDRKIWRKYTEADLDNLRPSPDDPQVIIPTGGVTGVPKMCVQSTWGLRGETASWVERGHITPYDCELAFGPMNGGTGRGQTVFTQLEPGAKTVMLTEFDEENSCRLTEEEKVTIWGGLPALMIRAITSPHFEKYDMSKLRMLMYAGMPLPPAVGEKVWNKGIRIMASGGAMSAIFVSSTWPYLSSKEACLTTMGVAHEGNEIKIVDAQGKEVPPGQIGRVRWWGQHYGFYNSPELDKRNWDEEGYEISDAIGKVDEEGNITVVGRAEDMITRGAEYIVPAEIEYILDTHPKVRQTAIVGMPDPELGERVCAYIVPAVGEKPTLDELRSFLEDRKVAKSKWPERLELIEALPITTGGKVTKRPLKEDIEKKLKAEGKI
jgi:acyl-coenzyme A synthetase/AMP-(fatty) acid ligase